MQTKGTCIHNPTFTSTHLCCSVPWIKSSAKVKHDTTRDTRSRQLLHADAVNHTKSLTQLVQLITVVALSNQLVDDSTKVKLRNVHTHTQTVTILQTITSNPNLGENS